MDLVVNLSEIILQLVEELQLMISKNDIPLKVVLVGLRIQQEVLSQ